MRTGLLSITRAPGAAKKGRKKAALSGGRGTLMPVGYGYRRSVAYSCRSSLIP